MGETRIKYGPFALSEAEMLDAVFTYLVLRGSIPGDLRGTLVVKLRQWDRDCPMVASIKED